MFYEPTSSLHALPTLTLPWARTQKYRYGSVVYSALRPQVTAQAKISHCLPHRFALVSATLKGLKVTNKTLTSPRRTCMPRTVWRLLTIVTLLS